MAFLNGRILISFALLGAYIPRASAADNNEALHFYEEEAKIITASLHPHIASQSPATVYVITAEDIKNSRSQTICDLFRTVPGVDVMLTRTFQCQVSIRGLNTGVNNRTLVLLDGKTILDPTDDYVIWENLPINSEEIARIEIVEGPASALYGANAVNGVINIITKTPEQLNGGLISYSGGEKDTNFATALYGKKTGNLDYKLGSGWRSGNRFEDANQLSSKTGKFDGLVGYNFSENHRLSFSGGIAKDDTQVALGGSSLNFLQGFKSFLRMDYQLDQTKFRFFWNHVKDSYTLDEDADVYDGTLQRALSLPWENQLTLGGGLRRTVLYIPGSFSSVQSQDLWSTFVEDEWNPQEHWSFVAGGRVDHHPLAGTNFSPRGSALYKLTPDQIFRLSAGTSFRNPTILENALNVNLQQPNPGNGIPNPPFTAINIAIQGNPNLLPEKMVQYEAAYNGRVGSSKITFAGFHYLINRMIDPGPQTTTLAAPNVNTQSSFVNLGAIKAWGYELGTDVPLRRDLDVFANYSYQSLRDSGIVASPLQQTAVSSPKHKINGGFKYKKEGLTADFWADWVDKTVWALNQTTPIIYGTVPDYFLLNMGFHYTFSGRGRGWELGVSAFNLANRRHFETLPPAGGQPGQNGEIIGSRWIGTITYRF